MVFSIFVFFVNTEADEIYTREKLWKESAKQRNKNSAYIVNNTFILFAADDETKRLNPFDNNNKKMNIFFWYF